ncbi:MAG: aspartate kinase [Fimbriimonadaceae bacterium]|nr:aspartate kinase [Fimbriimonadaceae bacterium]
MGERIVCKFGGTSVAEAAVVRQVEQIVRADPRRRYVVVSAPGKRFKDDQKITDLLLLTHKLADAGVDFASTYDMIADRFRALANDLGVPGAADRALADLATQLRAGATEDWVASRGEHISAVVLAAAFGATFVETAEHLGIDRRGLPTQDSYQKLGAALAGDGLFVIPGFYGRGPDGQVKVFSRGGSDISGAVVARAVGAAVYENWTDVPGFMMADPRIVGNPRPMAEVTYAELRELAYMGASVLHEEAVFPVREAGIPINIRNTHDPAAPGTRITATRDWGNRAVVGIAGRKGFSVLFINKNLMNKEVGFGRKVLEILASHQISYEHTPTGIDSMSVVVETAPLREHADAICDEVRDLLRPDEVEISHDLALINVVGLGMSHQPGIAARCFAALGEARVNVRMISQGIGELSIIIGVTEADFEAAVQALYLAFESHPSPQ